MSKVMQFQQIHIVVLFGGCVLTGTAATADDRTTYPPLSYEDGVRAPYTEASTIGRSENVESKLSAEFAEFLGGEERADRVVAGLRTGNRIRLWDRYRDGHRDGYHDRAAPLPTGEGHREWSWQGHPIDKHRQVTIDPPTGKMGYGNVRITLKLAQARLAQFGIAQPTNRELSAVLVGGKIRGHRIDGILTERASGGGWGAIAQRYDLKVGELMRNGKATTADPVVQNRAPPQAEPGIEKGAPHNAATDHRSPHEGRRTESGSSYSAAGNLHGARDTSPRSAGRSNGFVSNGNSGTTAANTAKANSHAAGKRGARDNGYIPSGSSSGSKSAYRGNTRGTHAKGEKAHANGYIPSGSSSGSRTAYRGNTRGTDAKGGKARANGYIPAGRAQTQGTGIVSASGGAAGAGRSSSGHARGHAKGYLPTGGRNAASGIVSANNASARGSTSSANGRGLGRGHGKHK